MTAFVEAGTKKFKIKDYFSGKIIKDQTEISDIYGNYNGYIDFDGVRYWDIRETKLNDVIPSVGDDVLPSDSRCRPDLILFKENSKEYTKAQDLKDELEILQRRDASLRNAAEKARRKNPGLKFIPKHMLC